MTGSIRSTPRSTSQWRRATARQNTVSGRERERERERGGGGGNKCLLGKSLGKDMSSFVVYTVQS